MRNLLKCSVVAIVCLLPLGASSPSDAAKATELALKVDSAGTKGAIGDAAPATSQGAGNGADTGANSTPAPDQSNKMNRDGTPAK